MPHVAEVLRNQPHITHHVSFLVEQISDQSVPPAMVQGAPAAILDPRQLIRESKLLCQLLQQIYAEPAAALVQCAVSVGGHRFQPGVNSYNNGKTKCIILCQFQYKKKYIFCYVRHTMYV